MHWIVIALAARDVADAEHQRHRLPTIVRPPGAVQIFIQVEQFRSIARLALHVAVDLVAIRNRIHQFRRDCFLAQIRPCVHHGLELLRWNLPRLANAVLHLVEP